MGNSAPAAPAKQLVLAPGSCIADVSLAHVQSAMSACMELNGRMSRLDASVIRSLGIDAADIGGFAEALTRFGDVEPADVAAAFALVNNHESLDTRVSLIMRVLRRSAGAQVVTPSQVVVAACAVSRAAHLVLDAELAPHADVLLWYDALEERNGRVGGTAPWELDDLVLALQRDRPAQRLFASCCAYTSVGDVVQECEELSRQMVRSLGSLTGNPEVAADESRVPTGRAVSALRAVVPWADGELISQALERGDALCRAKGLAYGLSKDLGSSLYRGQPEAGHPGYRYVPSITAQDALVCGISASLVQAFAPGGVELNTAVHLLPLLYCAAAANRAWARIPIELTEDDVLAAEDSWILREMRVHDRVSPCETAAILAAWLMAEERLESERSVRELFNQYDRKGTGLLDRSQLTRAIQATIEKVLGKSRAQHFAVAPLVPPLSLVLATEMLADLGADQVTFDDFWKGVRQVREVVQSQIKGEEAAAASVVAAVEALTTERTRRSLRA